MTKILSLSAAKITIQPIALERDDAAQFVGLSISTLEKLERQGAFPKARLLSTRRVGFIVRELIEWVEARPISTLLPPKNTGAKKPRPSQQDIQDADLTR